MCSAKEMCAKEILLALACYDDDDDDWILTCIDNYWNNFFETNNRYPKRHELINQFIKGIR